MLSPIIAEIANEHKETVKVCKVNTDENQELAIQYNIVSIPTLMFFKNGKLLKTIVGFHSKGELNEIINKLIVGTPISQVSSKLEYEVKPVINECIKEHDILYNAFYNAFNDFTKSEVKVRGTSNILMQPEFNNADRIREIISKFDDQTIVNKIKEDDSGVNIYIGSENDFDDDVTIIKTKYSVNGEEGTIALIGPKRMEYERVVTLLEYIKKNIEG